MDNFDHGYSSRSERVRRALMLWCAVFLFALGFFLLLAPKRAQGEEPTDRKDYGAENRGAKDRGPTIDPEWTGMDGQGMEWT